MISNVLVEMTEPVSHKRYKKYIFLSVAQIYLASPTRNQFHTRKITSIESTGCESCQRLEQHSSQMGNLPEDYFHSDVTWKVQLPLLS